jgi:PAS domain S-box-containing protein
MTMLAAANAADLALTTLEARFAAARLATEVTFAASEVLGLTLGADRAGYVLADATVGAVLVEGLWGLPLRACDTLGFADFGTSKQALQAGRSLLVNDLLPGACEDDDRPALSDRSIRATLVVPVLEREKVVAFIFAQSLAPQAWGEETLAFAARLAERTRMARQQVRIESRRRESDRHMRVFADAMPIQVWAADNYGMLYWHNQKVVEFSGADNADLDGFGYQDIIHPDDLPKALDDWYQALKAGVGHDTSFRTRCADGTYRWFVCRSVPIRDDEGNIIRYLGTSTDIHDQKCAEDALARLNADLEEEVAARTQERDLTWKTASDLFLITTLDHEAIRLNPAWSQLLGWNEAEMLGVNGPSFIHAEDREATFAALALLEGDGDKVHYENRLLRKNGSPVWVSWIVTRHGERNFHTGRDITAARDLIKAQGDLTHASRVATLGELTASIAHEVNQPLAAIMTQGNAAGRWLSRAQPNLAEARQAIADMMAEAKRASDIIARLRSLAMRGEAERAPCDVRLLIEDSSALIKSQLRLLKATLHLEIAPDLPVITADRVQLQQVIINLALNAAQAMTHAQSPERHITLSALPCPQGVAFAMADTGPGIAPDLKPRIFEAFFTTKADGMGMGLSIARSIVEAHGGKLEIDPDYTGGTQFTFTVSAREENKS